jgi:hypothetical protein
MTTDNNIIGSHWRYSTKTKHIIDDDPAPDGMEVRIFMGSAKVGACRWLEQRIAELDIGLISDGADFPDEIPEGYNPYVIFNAMRVDDGSGLVLTFTGSSYGSKNAFCSVWGAWRLMNAGDPIVVPSQKKRADKNGNIAPVFKIVGWTGAPAVSGGGGGLLPAPAQERIADDRPMPATADLIDDEIPW